MIVFQSLAVLLLSSSAAAHMIMAQPVPYSNDVITKDPLGSGDYPCKNGLGYTISEMNEMVVGETQTLSFRPDNSAVHGGGSCQMSVTLDEEPTVDSIFKVVHSIEGACPGLDGGAATFEYVIPDSIPSGRATIAWTWFAKLSGVPEMYMNCAPVEITGGASDSSAFDQLPDMFVANVPEVDCTSPISADTIFPNPGDSLVEAEGSDLQDPTGSSCGEKVSNDGNSSPVQPETSSPPKPPVRFPQNTGGIFVPNATGVLSASLTTFATSASPKPSNMIPPHSNSTVVAPPESLPSLESTTCTEDGKLLCNGRDKWGLCNHGSVVWLSTAPDTECQSGQIVPTKLDVKRWNSMNRIPQGRHFSFWS